MPTTKTNDLLKSAIYRVQTTTMSSSSLEKPSEKLIVSVVDANLPLRQGETLQVSTFPFGSSSTPSLYLQVPKQSKNLTLAPDTSSSASDASYHLCEIQSLPADFGSFLLTPGNTIVGKDDNLYITTAVDPLFLFLQHEPVADQWQPWDQIVEGMDATLRAALPHDRNQLTHLYARMPVDEQEVYYKFSTSKALAWLQQKFERVQETLVKQQKAQTNIASSSRSSTANNFHLGKQATSTSTSQTAQEQQERQQALRRERDAQRCRAEAVQIICDYLNETWKLRFLNHVDLDKKLLEATVSPGKRAAASTGESAVPVPKKAKTTTVVRTTTPGQKKLAKVNTKGMKKMTAFFGVVAKKENTPNKK